MGWTKKSIDGKIMWESSEGQRVHDSSLIYKMEDEGRWVKRARHPIYISYFWTIVIVVIIGLMLGLIFKP